MSCFCCAQVKGTGQHLMMTLPLIHPRCPFRDPPQENPRRYLNRTQPLRFKSLNMSLQREQRHKMKVGRKTFAPRATLPLIWNFKLRSWQGGGGCGDRRLVLYLSDPSPCCLKPKDKSLRHSPWRRASARNFSFVISSIFKFHPYQLVWYAIIYMKKFLHSD